MTILKTQQYIFFLISSFVTLQVTAQQTNFDFTENKGQWEEQVKFMGNFGSGAFFLQKQGFTVLLHNPEDLSKRMGHSHGAGINNNINNNNSSEISKPGTGGPDGLSTHKDDSLIVHSHAYRVHFEGASDNTQIIPDKVQESFNNYFIGNDKSKWAADCKIYKAITYRNIYPGIDIHYYPDNGTLKYDIVVNPGANTDNIAMKYEGAEKLSIKNNQLYIKTSVGEVKELYPYSYQFSKEKGKTEVNCKYEIVNGNTVKFKVKNYSRDIPLIIDPSLIFSSFSGSTADNWGFTATPGPDGSLYGGGIVFANGYPITVGAYQTNFGGGTGGNRGTDIGITRFNATGTSRIYSTYLGGSGNDYPCSLIADPQGNLIIMGRTYSPNFPVTTPLLGTGGSSDLFVAKLNATGNILIGSMRIGGAEADAVNVEEQRGGTARKISTIRFYGDDIRGEVILDGSNNIYVATQTQSTDFPVKGGFQTSKAGGQDGVILKIDPSCNNIIFSSYLGGAKDDGVFVIDISPLTGNLYVAGTTSSVDFPGNKTGVIQGSNQGGETDGFVTEITNDGSTIIRTTYLGTGSYDAIYGIKFDKLGFPYVMGITEGAWPVVKATYSNAGSKQFVAKLKTDLSAYVYSSVFGSGSSLPNISPVAFLVDRCENVYVSGWGGSPFPGVNSTNDPFKQAGTNGMPVSPNAIKSTTDNKDFYFIVLKKNITGLLYATFFGQGGGFGEHVDGGTSRYDQGGAIYQAICANCGGNSNGVPNPPYPTTPGVVAPVSGAANSGGCNLGVVKIAFNFAGVAAGVKAFINSVFDTSGCVPLTVQFKDTVRNATSYEWNFGDGSPTLFTTNFDISHTYNLIGNYRVMLVGIDSSTCNIRDTTYTTIRVRNNEAFLAFTSLKLQPCESLSYQFTNTSTKSPTALPFTNQSFIWDFGDGSPRVVSGTASIAHSYIAAGTYKVKLILPDTNYCNSPDSIPVTLRVSPLVKAQFETPLLGCAPYDAVFNNTSLAGQDFLWDFGDGTTSTDINPTHTYLTPGSYSIKLVATDTTTCNKVDDTTVVIKVSIKPTADYTYSPLTPQQNFPYTFTNASSPDAIRFLWSFGDGEALSTRSRGNFDHQYNKTGTFNACLAAYNDVGCVDTVCKPLQNIVVPKLDLPNAFTPLANATNNVIYVRGFGIGKMKWRIYNRFGNLVFESDTQSRGWDGRYKGVVQPMEVYAYTLEVEFTDGTKATKKGDITLIR
jgi:gliding motility-associated-like protein